MAAVSLQLAAVLQNATTENTVRQPNTNETAVNANQAQGAPVPQDTVTLTNQTSQGRQTQQDPEQQPPDPNLFAAGAQIVALAQGNATAPASATVNPPNLNAANAAVTPDQQLQVLDQALQQLGIDPESISLFNRLAMLLYANDPEALQQFIQQLQQTTTNPTQGTTGTPTANVTESHGGGAAPDQTPGSTPQAIATNPAGSSFAQFEEFQITATVITQQASSPTATDTNPAGSVINVTI